MKKIAFAIAISALAVLGCQKEDVKDLTPATITLQGIYNESMEAVKSDYEKIGDTYYFKWVSGDKFIAQSYNGADYNSPTLFTASTGDAAQVPFTGTPAAGYALDTYAFYPNLNDGQTFPTNNFVYLKTAITPISLDGTESDIADRVSAASATVQLVGTNIEDKDHPMAHIPMIGVKDGNGDYQFTAATGVLKITIKNFPTTATKVCLDRISGTFPLNGRFVFDTNYEIKSSYVKENYGLKYLNVTASTVVEDRSFYFPLPTGTIPANTLRISVYDTATEKTWALGVASKAITIAKGVVTELPAMSYAGSTSVSIRGTAAAPQIRFRMASEQKFYFQITNVVGVPGAYNGVMSSSQTWSIPTTGTPAYFPTNNASGLKYLYYKITKSSDNTAIYTSDVIPFYYLAPDDETLAGTYKFEALYCLAFCDRSAWRNLTESSDNRLVLEVSDNPSKGSVMITDYMGLKSDGTVTNKNLTNSDSPDSPSVFQLNAAGNYLPKAYLNPSLFTSGSPIYGWLNSSNGHISFENTANQSLFSYNGVAYTLRNGLATYPGFIFEYDSSASPKKITYGSEKPLTLVPYNADVPGSGIFDGATSMLYPSKSNSVQGEIVGYKQ